MLPQSLHNRVRVWIRRPLARAASVLLLLVMVLSSTPVGVIHAHAAGEHEHRHASQPADAPHDIVDHGQPAEPGEVIVLHAHDAGAPSSALLVTELPALDGHAPVAPRTRIALSPPPSSARIPPQRPPIA